MSRSTSALEPLIKRTLLAVTKFRDSFAGFVQQMPVSIDLSTLPPEDVAEFMDLRSTNIAMHVFSDTFIYTVPFSDPMPRPILSIYTALCAFATVVPASLADGLPMRGAIEVGWAGEIGPGEVYGPALFQAYELEATRAQYPRVVIGEKLVRLLLSMTVCEDPDDKRANMTAHWAGECLNLITRDFDGVHVLNYLGDGYREACVTDADREQWLVENVVRPAYRFVTGEVQRFESAGDEKHRDRYLQLKAYFDVSLPIWGIEVEA